MLEQTYANSSEPSDTLSLAALMGTVRKFEQEFPEPEYQGFFVSPAIADAITKSCAYRSGSDLILSGLSLTEFAGLRTHVRSWMPNDCVIPIPFRLKEKFEDFEMRARIQIELDKFRK